MKHNHIVTHRKWNLDARKYIYGIFCKDCGENLEKKEKRKVKVTVRGEQVYYIEL